MSDPTRTPASRTSEHALGRLTLVQRLAHGHVTPGGPRREPVVAMDGEFAAAAGLLRDIVAPPPVRAAARRALGTPPRD